MEQALQGMATRPGTTRALKDVHALLWLIPQMKRVALDQVAHTLLVQPLPPVLAKKSRRIARSVADAVRE